MTTIKAVENGVLRWYHGPGGDVVLDSSITEIRPNAFARREDVNSIALPPDKGVRPDLGDGAV